MTEWNVGNVCKCVVDLLLNIEYWISDDCFGGAVVMCGVSAVCSDLHWLVSIGQRSACKQTELVRAQSLPRGLAATTLATPANNNKKKIIIINLYTVACVG